MSVSWNERPFGAAAARWIATLGTLSIVLACSGGSDAAGQPTPPAAGATDPTPPVGMTVEHVTASIAPTGGARRHPITIVRFDPAHYRARLFTARADGGERTLDRWVREQHLVAAINAAMYEPDGRATALMIHGGVDESPVDDVRFGGFYAIEPRTQGTAAWALVGRDCASGPGAMPGGGTFDLAALRAAWGSIAASYRLLDCESHAIGWVDPDRYSAAAIAIDADGRLVLVHSRTPYRMSELATMLAAPELGLRQAIFVEGGPEATLVVESEGVHLREVGLRRDLPDGVEPEHDTLYALPNVLGIERVD